MTVVRFVLRFVGWLLTPIVAWAASFGGATLGAILGRGVAALTGLFISVVCGGLAAAVALLLWLRLLRRSPRLRHALEVTEEGTPVAALGEGSDEGAS